MRTFAILSALLLVVALAVPSAHAGDARLVRLDSYASPGGTVGAAVELTNDSGGPMKFKLKSRLMGDTKNGKKAKQTITLGAGEKRTVDLSLGVPGGASGTLQLEAKVRWSGGKQDITDWVLCIPPSDPGGGPAIELLTLTGTVSVVSTDPPMGRGRDASGNGMPAWMGGELKLVTEEGDTWWLVGDEASYLLRLMVQAEVDEAPGRIEGYPFGDPSMTPGPLAANAKALRVLARSRSLLWVTDFEVRGIEDPRDRIVPHRYVLDGPISKLTEAKEMVVQAEREWQQFLSDAGIRLPAKDWPENVPLYDARPASASSGFPIGPPDFWPPWKVDLEKETVLAVFAGPKRTTGYAVWILEVSRQDDGSLLVKYAVSEPSDYEVLIEVPTSPFAIVAIPKTDARIRFELTDMPAPDPWPIPMMR